MKVLLVNPPARQLKREDIVISPLGLGYIAAAAIDAGHEVDLLDAFGEGLSWESFEQRAKGANADVVGIGGMTPTFDTSKRAAKILKKYFPKLIVGGPHVTAVKDKIFKDMPEADCAIVGESERSFPSLLDIIDKGGDVLSVPGVITRDGQAGKAESIGDLDALPFPARQLLPNDKYCYTVAGKGPVAAMMTSRGCPYSCIFCDKSMVGNVYRARSPQSVVDELEEITGRFGINTAIFYDDLFTLDRERVAQICELILTRGIKIKWKCEGRVDKVDLEILELMKRAGAWLIAFGVETASEKGLTFLRKETTVEQSRDAFAMAGRAGLDTIGYFLLGIPVESYEEELETIDLAISLKPTYAQFSLLSPFPGTELYDWATERSAIKHLDFMNPVDHDLSKPAIVTEEWTEAKLKEILLLAHRRFYFRPGYILGRLISVQKPMEIARQFRSALGLAGWLRSGAVTKH